MKKLAICIFIGLVTASCSGKGSPVTDNSQQQNQQSQQQTQKEVAPISVPVISAPSSALAGKESLTAAEAEEYMGLLQNAWKAAIKAAYEESFKAGKIKIGSNTMPVWWTTYGKMPEGGWDLFISLHGGGGAPAATNNQQWNNQKTLYKPDHSVYLCPRAITDTWDLHFRPESDTFYEAIINYAVAALDVNPDRVYIMGYSAGGDGVWRIGPRMADHWAAATMMAGHPGDVSLLSLRNTPFGIWCGANDSSYDRNKECAARIEEMKALHADDPDGYIVDGHIVEGKEHWMDLEDAAAVPWMQKFTRNPYPDKVVWCQGDVMKGYCYWLGVEADKAQKGMRLIASVDSETNTVVIEHSDYSKVTVYLNDTLVDLDKPVKVVCGDNVLFEGTLTRKPSTMLSCINARGDMSYIFPASIEVSL